MKNRIRTLLAVCAVIIVSLTGCHPKENISVSRDTLWFSPDADVQTIEVVSDCAWSIVKNEEADWYTISPMSAEKSAGNTIVTVSVDPYDGNEYRQASFTINSEKGKSHVVVFVSQNKLEFADIVNTVYGVVSVEHWNTDYFGNMIEDSYKQASFNPNDTTTGFRMFFAENGVGAQEDKHGDSAVYYLFSYEFNPATRILHIEFENTAQTESYDATVLTAAEGLFRFQHEYKPNFWERAEMLKIGVINPDVKAILSRASAKRKTGGPVFDID